MDAINFAETIRRYIEHNQYTSLGFTLNLSPEELVQKMEKWAAEHPVKTRQSELLKILPNAALDERGVLRCDPCDLMHENIDYCPRSCEACREVFWLKEITE